MNGIVDDFLVIVLVDGIRHMGNTVLYGTAVLSLDIYAANDYRFSSSMVRYGTVICLLSIVPCDIWYLVFRCRSA